MSPQENKICCYIMCKNEQTSILKTLNSVSDYVDSIVINDTGSTDNTIQLCLEFSVENKVPFFLIQNDFVDFATTRNTGLEYIKNNIDCNLILLLDANDELVVTDKEKFRSQEKSTLCQVKLSTDEIEESTFLSPRLIRKDENHYYLFPIHEQLVNDLNLKYSSIPADSFFIKQKRDYEDQFEKTKQRWKSDEKILLKCINNFLTDRKTLAHCYYFLAQTYECMGEAYYRDAINNYKLRLDMDEKQEEEIHFVCTKKIGQLTYELYTLMLDTDRKEELLREAIGWLFQSYFKFKRIDGLFILVQHFHQTQNIILAFSLCQLCLSIKYPQNCLLEVETEVYEYLRYLEYAKLADTLGLKEDGIQALDKATEKFKERNYEDLNKSEKERVDECSFVMQNIMQK